MSDNYQAIYDAVRSRISGGNIGEIVREIASRSFDFSRMQAIVQQEFMCAAVEMQRPSAIYRPTIAPDSDQWCALYGPNLAEGVSGFGDTPAEAMADFDLNWSRKRTPVAVRLAADATDPQ